MFALLHPLQEQWRSSEYARPVLQPYCLLVASWASYETAMPTGPVMHPFRRDVTSFSRFIFFAAEKRVYTRQT